MPRRPDDADVEHVELLLLVLLVSVAALTGLARALDVPYPILLAVACRVAFGAIVSPTDPLAAVTIARRRGVPRRAGWTYR